MSVKMNDFPTAKLAAHQLATAIAADLCTALATTERALLLVSGGRSPITLFKVLSTKEVEWSRIDISLVDERSVAPDGEAANAGLVRASLMSGPARQARWLPLMPSEVFATAKDPWRAAQEATALANVNVALLQPAVIVLGLGTDGHAASLFPDAPQWPDAAISPARYVCIQPAAAPHARVSVSLQALRLQKRCYMWAVGTEKVATLERLRQLPLVQQMHQGGEVNEAGKRLLMQAGPVACLMADPLVQLEVYCSNIE